MHVSSPIPHKKARIEIIPLIDIMFFLLASFMMVSLSQVHMKGIKVNLPTGASGETQSKARLHQRLSGYEWQSLLRQEAGQVRGADCDIGKNALGKPGCESVLARGSRHRARQHYPRARYSSLGGFLQNRL